MRTSYLLCAVLVLASPRLLAGGHEGREGHHRDAILVPGQYQTIQDAVDAADPGDVIVVGPGTYCEQVLITTSDLTLRARDDEHRRRPVLSGACSTGGVGFKVLGTTTAPLVNVAIEGFVVEGFETGILLQNVVRSRLTWNEVRDNTDSAAPSAQNGIMLVGSSFNEISGNFAHGNGHMGIAVRAGSNGNTVRRNRLVDNQVTYTGSCSLMVYGTSIGNQILENEVVDAVGAGIMIGPAGVQTQTLIAGNRVHGHALAGIVIEPGSQPNLVIQNDARNNNTSGTAADLQDLNTPTSTNLWLRNRGTCAPGNAGCP